MPDTKQPNNNTNGTTSRTQLGSIEKVLTSLAALFIVILGLQYIAQDLIAPILMAFFLAILLRPLFRFYRGRGFGRGVSITLVLISISVLLVGLIILLTRSVSIMQESLSIYADNIRVIVGRASEDLQLDEQTTETITQSISPESLGRLISTIAGSLGNLTLYFIVVPILAILLVLQMDAVPQHVANQMIANNPKLRNLSKFADSMMIYVVGRFKVNLLTGLLFSIALLILDVDFPFFWGVMTVFLSFIPYLGIVLAAAFPTLLALANQGVWAAVGVVVSVVLINLFAENVLDPIIQGKGNKLSPAVIIVSVIFWGWILGAVGLILATPLTVLLKLVMAEYKETVWLAQLIEGDFSALPEKTKGSPSRLKKLGKNVSAYFGAGKN